MFDETWNFEETDEGQYRGIKYSVVSDHVLAFVYENEGDGSGRVSYKKFVIYYDPDQGITSSPESGSFRTGAIDSCDQFEKEVKEHFKEYAEAKSGL